MTLNGAPGGAAPVYIRESLSDLDPQTQPVEELVEDLRAQRLALNETIFRRANEDIRTTGERLQHDFQAFMCECADINCDKQIPVPADKYQEVRSDPTHFLVAPGHEDPEIERVLEEHEGFNVIEKIGPGRDVAERDPLS